MDRPLNALELRAHGVLAPGLAPPRVATAGSSQVSTMDGAHPIHQDAAWVEI
jgi:hypothetical protein